MAFYSYSTFLKFTKKLFMYALPRKYQVSGSFMSNIRASLASFIDYSTFLLFYWGLIDKYGKVASLASQENRLIA